MGEGGDSAPVTPAGAAGADRARGRTRLVPAAVWAVLVVPLAVAVGVLAQPRWYPILDLAQTEMRVRDVTSDHPPLVGLTGRIGTLAEPGSHPGPVSFYGLWPAWEASGQRAWGMVVGSALLSALALALTLWLLWRRGGTSVVLAGGALLALLTRFYGADLLVFPWNPYLPVLWFALLLVATWSVLCDDERAIPVAVLAASFCVQTHISYMGLGVGLGAVAGIGALALLRRRWGDPAARRRTLVWLGVAAVVGVVLWAPPVIQQLTEDRGNLSILWKHFTEPPEEPIGASRGVRLWLEHLHPGRLVAETTSFSASAPPSGRPAIWPGVVVLVVWAATAALSVVRWRQGSGRRTVALHAVAAVGLVLSAVSAMRIFGTVWHYLTLWGWGVLVLVLGAIGATVADVVGANLPAPRRGRAMTVAAVALVAVIGVSTVAFTVDAAETQVDNVPLTRDLGVLTRGTVAALEEPDVPGGGEDGTYLVTWTDPVNLGSQGFGLVNELERAGFDVGVPPGYAFAAPYRGLEAGEYQGEVHLEVGSGIEGWRQRPGVVEAVYLDPRTPAQRDEFERRRDALVAELEADGLDDLVSGVDTALFQTSLDPRLTRAQVQEFAELIRLGLPAAVFIAPA